MEASSMIYIMIIGLMTTVGGIANFNTNPNVIPQTVEAKTENKDIDQLLKTEGGINVIYQAGIDKPSSDES